MSKLQKDPSGHSGFRHPPLWIHVAEAGNWLRSRREAKKRAVIRILDRLPVKPKKAAL